MSDECGCCDFGTSLISQQIAKALRKAEGWANASAVPEDGLIVAEALGYDLADYAGLYQSIYIVIAYEVYSTEEEGVQGIWTRTTTITHSGPGVVDLEAQINKVATAVDDPDPTEPKYVSQVISVGDCAIEVGQEVLPDDVRLHAVGNVDGSPFITGESGAEELNGYASGVFLSGSGSFAVAQKCNFNLHWEIDSDTFTTSLQNGEMQIPVAGEVVRFDVETEVESVFYVAKDNVTFRESEAIFSAHALDNPDDWEQLDFDSQGGAYYDISNFQTRANVWPIYVEI